MSKLGKLLLTLLVLPLPACSSSSGFSPSPAPPPPPPPSGPFPVSPAEIRDLGNFHSSLLGNDHRVRVYLPPGYTSSTARFPVLYIQDGATAFGAGGMQFDSVATALIGQSVIRPLIMVAIYASPQRDVEYVPWSGSGVTYARMMTEELKPAIDAQFRTSTGPDDTGVTGYSLGGIITWYLGLWQTPTFHLIAAQSGALTPSDTLILRTVRNLPAKLPVRVWYDRGTNDGEAKNQVLEGMMRQALLSHGWVEGTDFRYLLVPGATHTVTSFKQRVDPILRFLYPH